MIKDLSLALKKILEDNGIQPVVLNRPTQNQHQENRVSLFLYDIRENVELRSNEFAVERQSGQIISHPPPIRINCSYLVTVWPKNESELELLEEHELLSQILQIFASHSTLPESVLTNNSVLKKQEPSIPIVTAHADTLRNLGEFWTAMGEKLRASISVTATLSFPVREDIPAPMVTTLQGDFVQSEEVRESWLQIGGRVIDSEGRGVPSALVDVLDAKNKQVILRVTSDQEGYFVLSRVLPGIHPVRVIATGYNPQNQDFKVPSNLEDYEIHLTTLAST